MSAETILIECLDANGRVLSRERIVLGGAKRSFTVGRSIHADVTLDDPYAAGMHASVEIMPDGQILASDLGSINGLVVSGQRHRGALGLSLADGALQIGRTRLRVRTARDDPAPEVPDEPRPASLLRNPALVAGIGAVLAAAQITYVSWLGAPQDIAASIVTGLAGLAMVSAVWVAIWGLLSRVMQGEWRWLRHAAILFGILVLVVAVNAIIDAGWFMLALPRWNAVANWMIGALGIGLLIYLHLIHASSLTGRRAAQVACVVPALLFGAALWTQDRYQTRDVNYIGGGLRIYPAGLRVRPADSVDSYFRSVSALRASADKRRLSLPATEVDEEF